MPKEEKEQISQRNLLSEAMSEAGASGWKPLLPHQRMCCKRNSGCKRNCFVSETPLSFVQKQADRQSDNDNNKTKGKTCTTKKSSNGARLPREAVKIPSLLHYSLKNKNPQTSVLNDR